MEIVFTELSNVSRVMHDRRNEDSGKRSLMNKLSKRSEKTRRIKKDVREKEDIERGNGKWHDAVRG